MQRETLAGRRGRVEGRVNVCAVITAGRSAAISAW